MDTKEALMKSLLGKDISDKNHDIIESVSYYAKVHNMIERTHVAMGKKATYKVSTSSTKNEKLKTNVFAATH